MQLFLGALLQCACANFLSLPENVDGLYSTNPVCRKRFCINPIFPALEDLGNLEQRQWLCADFLAVKPLMNFCQAVVDYDPALPVSLDGTDTLEDVVRAQEEMASTMYFYHLAGMGIEAWENPDPRLADDCIRSVWRMTCHTYFPRKPDATCQAGQPTTYVRPCQSSCHNYIRACNVECCDESVQCVFEHQVSWGHVWNQTGAKHLLATKGYVPHDGPSSFCTGATGRSTRPSLVLMFAAMLTASCQSGSLPSFPKMMSRKLLLTVFLAILAFSLHGCDYEVPTHRVGNWRQEPDYLIDFEFIPPGGSSNQARLNSCSLDRLSQTLQCSGRGVCKMWNEDNMNNPISFCACDRDWADPECRTRRKSQTIAFLLSLFFGFLGADLYYMGLYVMGTLKLVTLGGFGVWWAVDIVRIGSTPVEADRFNLAADLHHVAFILLTVTFAMVIGYVITYYQVRNVLFRRRNLALLMRADEEASDQDLHKAAYESKHQPGHYGAADASKQMVL